jgi:hypothetical protein
MFAKLEKFRTIEAIDRSRSRRARQAAACNDNRRVCFSAAVGQPLRRPVLGCRWIKGNAGALKCMWYVETVEESAADEPLGKSAA